MIFVKGPRVPSYATGNDLVNRWPLYRSMGKLQQETRNSNAVPHLQFMTQAVPQPQNPERYILKAMGPFPPWVPNFSV